MEKSTSPIKQAEESKSITRRDALKALAAASSAVAAAAFLPSKWTKPVIQAGVLPAHAQGTIQYSCYLQEPIIEGNVQFLFEFSTTPPTPGLWVLLELILGSSSEERQTKTDDDGKINGKGLIGCGNAGLDFQLVWWNANQTQIYCQSKLVMVQENPNCTNGEGLQSPPGVEINIGK